MLPIATTDGSDSVSRVWAAWRWLSDPHWITHGVWGPLHFYMIGAVMAVFTDPVLPPILLHVGFGIAAAVVMDAFTRIEFGGRRAALLAALTFAVYPIAVRNSVAVRSEAPFVLLLLAAMRSIASARRDSGGRRHAILAGLCMTLAAMLRYEAWILIPCFALLLWRKRSLAILFGAVAMLHPVIWMIGNAAEFGDPLYSITWANHWEMNLMGRSAVGLRRHLRDAVDFVILTFRGLTPVVGLACIAGAGIALAGRRASAPWLLPPCVLAGAMLASIARGSLVPKLNYTVNLGTLLFPFSAVFYERLRVDALGVGRYAAVCVVVVASVLVCSLGGGFAVLPSFVGISPVPRIEKQDTALLLPAVVLANLQGEDEGLISDFYGWGTTHYVALLTRLHPERIYVAPGARNQKVDLAPLTEFLGRHSGGVIVLKPRSRFAQAIGADAAGTAAVGPLTLRLEAVQTVVVPREATDPSSAAMDAPPSPWLEIFRYSVVSGSGRSSPEAIGSRVSAPGPARERAPTAQPGRTATPRGPRGRALDSSRGGRAG